MYLEATNCNDIFSEIGNLNLGKKDLLMILLAENNHTDIPTLMKNLNMENINFFGGVFPGLIYNEFQYKEGVIISIFKDNAPSIIFKELSRQDNLVPLFEDCLNLDHTAILFVDGHSDHVDSFLNEVYLQYGNSINYIGGGAGYLGDSLQPCLFNNEGLYNDAAIMTIINKSSSVTAKHGWKRLSGPYLATKTNGNIIEELNWENAFSVYRNIIKNNTGVEIDKENFSKISIEFPVGITKGKSEMVVRDFDILLDDNKLLLRGGIQENVVLDLLSADHMEIINAAESAATECCEQINKPIDRCFIFDSVSRYEYLGSDFSIELKKVRDIVNDSAKEVVPQGALTLGEISSFHQGTLEFFNKSIVIALLNGN